MVPTWHKWVLCHVDEPLLDGKTPTHPSDRGWLVLRHHQRRRLVDHALHLENHFCKMDYWFSASGHPGTVRMLLVLINGWFTLSGGPIWHLVPILARLLLATLADIATTWWLQPSAHVCGRGMKSVSTASSSDAQFSGVFHWGLIPQSKSGLWPENGLYSFLVSYRVWQENFC